MNESQHFLYPYDRLILLDKLNIEVYRKLTCISNYIKIKMKILKIPTKMNGDEYIV